jgi:ABC-type proline/glycine betaine transport system permease subunit
MPVLITGSVLTALLAVFLDSLLGEVQFLLNPRAQPIVSAQ